MKPAACSRCHSASASSVVVATPSGSATSRRQGADGMPPCGLSVPSASRTSFGPAKEEVRAALDLLPPAEGVPGGKTVRHRDPRGVVDGALQVEALGKGQSVAPGGDEGPHRLAVLGRDPQRGRGPRRVGPLVQVAGPERDAERLDVDPGQAAGHVGGVDEDRHRRHGRGDLRDGQDEGGRRRDVVDDDETRAVGHGGGEGRDHGVRVALDVEVRGTQRAAAGLDGPAGREVAVVADDDLVPGTDAAGPGAPPRRPR